MVKTYDLSFTETANATAIGEADMLSIGRKLPPSVFVFDGAVIVLKLGIALLARCALTAVVIETRDSKPCAISRRLTSLRVEQRGKWVLFGKHSTRALQIIFGDTAFVHSEAEAFISDELRDPDRLIKSRVLLWGPVYFVLIDQHWPLASSSSFCSA